MLLCFPAASPPATGRNVELRHVVNRTGLKMKEIFFCGAQKVCELEETAHRWVFLGNSGTGNSKEAISLPCICFLSCMPRRSKCWNYGGMSWKKKYLRAQRVFDWKRMFTAESLWAILEQEIRISCLAVPGRSDPPLELLRHVVKLGNERKISFSRLTSLRIGRKCSPLDLLGQFWNRKLEISYFALSPVEWLPREKKLFSRPNEFANWKKMLTVGSSWEILVLIELHFLLLSSCVL